MEWVTQRSRRRAGVLKGVYYGGGASIGHRQGAKVKRGYTVPQELQRCNRSVGTFLGTEEGR